MPDRRALLTRAAIKDGMLALLEKTPFSAVTVTALCKESGVGRATFYTHYTGLTEVLDELAEDAISATAPARVEGIAGISILADKMRETTDPRELEPYMELLPVCQRVSDNAKYRVLFSDPFVAEYILTRIYRSQRERMVPWLTAHYRVNREEADRLFLMLLHGAFAVNRALGWRKDEGWYAVQRVILRFLQGGFHALETL